MTTTTDQNSLWDLPAGRDAHPDFIAARHRAAVARRDTDVMRALAAENLYSFPLAIRQPGPMEHDGVPWCEVRDRFYPALYEITDELDVVIHARPGQDEHPAITRAIEVLIEAGIAATMGTPITAIGGYRWET